MEQIIIEALKGNLDGATLLMLFIIGIMTKRFVPWWVHEEALEKLKEYEEAAPALLDEITELIDLINDDDTEYPLRSRRVKERQENIHHVIRKNPRFRPKRRARSR